MTSRTASLLATLVMLALASPLWAAPNDFADADTAQVCGCRTYVPIAVVSPPGGFQVGCGQTYVLKASGGNPTRDTWTLVDAAGQSFGPCDEANDGHWLRCALANGMWLAPAFVGTLPGNRAAILSAFEERFDRDTDPRPDICYEDYTGNRARVLHVLMVMPFESSGRRSAQVVGIVGFFLQRLPTHGDDLVGEFISFVVD